jgi:hypothetical protein
MPTWYVTPSLPSATPMTGRTPVTTSYTVGRRQIWDIVYHYLIDSAWFTLVDSNWDHLTWLATFTWDIFTGRTLI